MEIGFPHPIFKHVYLDGCSDTHDHVAFGLCPDGIGIYIVLAIYYTNCFVYPDTITFLETITA